MAHLIIESGSFVPKYHQLTEMLREQIAKLEPHQVIPSEPQLCEMYNVSRTTARKALDDLLRDGLVYRIQGRGTYVAESKLPERFVHRTAGMYEDMTSRGYSVQTQVLQQCVVPATECVANKLNLEPGTPLVKLVRVRSIDSRKMILTTTYVPHDLCPGLEKDDLTQGSLYKILETKYQLQLDHGARVIEVKLCNEEEANLLDTLAGEPVIVLTGIMYDSHGRVVEYTEAKLRGDRTQIEIQVFKDPLDH
jgi:GntR family transcriptional regulator